MGVLRSLYVLAFSRLDNLFLNVVNAMDPRHVRRGFFNIVSILAHVHGLGPGSVCSVMDETYTFLILASRLHWLALNVDWQLHVCGVYLGSSN